MHDTVDIVEAGADPSGNERIDPVFNDLVQDHRTIEFPPGKYLYDHLSLFVTGGDLEDFRMVGDDATLVHSGDGDGDVTGLVGRDVVVENFTMDATSPDQTPGIKASGDDGVVFRNVRYDGFVATTGLVNGIKTNTSDGTSLAENVRVPDGSDGVALFCGAVDGGEVRVRNCHFEECKNNGVYASQARGPVHVEGGTFRNNNVAAVRLGGAPGCTVRNATIEITKTIPPIPGRDPPINQRGIRINGPGPVFVENTDIRCTGGEGFGAVVNAFNGGSLELRNVDIRVERDYTHSFVDGTSWAISVQEAESGAGHRRTVGERVFRDVDIRGSARGNAVIRIDRANTDIENCCIHQSGVDRDGIRYDSGSNHHVADTTINVPGDAIVRNNVTVNAENISETGRCPDADVARAMAVAAAGAGAGLGAIVADDSLLPGR